MDGEFVLRVVRQEVGRGEIQNALPPADLFPGNERHPSAAGKEDKAGEAPRLGPGRGQQKRPGQEIGGHGEILHPAILFQQDVMAEGKNEDNPIDDEESQASCQPAGSADQADIRACPGKALRRSCRQSLDFHPIFR